ncbi:MAG: hypothetical protein R8K21_05680 [Mariprofundales bacterium]
MAKHLTEKEKSHNRRKLLGALAFFMIAIASFVGTVLARLSTLPQ